MKPGEVRSPRYGQGVRRQTDIQVFTNWNCAILGFAVVDISISSPETCAKLRIPSDPSMEQLVTAFMSHVGKDLEKAKLIFRV